LAFVYVPLARQDALWLHAFDNSFALNLGELTWTPK